jgi:CRP/FNR family transcriptional regulator
VSDTGHWLTRFPGLAGVAKECAGALATGAQEVSLPAGARIYEPGGTPSAFLLLAEGSIVVRQISESGREIVLYRIAGGDSCMLTTACLLGHDTYTAEAVSETDVTAIAISRAAFEEMLARSASFRSFVFEGLAARLTAMFRLIEQVAFSRMDSRLAQKLVELSHGADTISITQAQLATELGTAREVVTRVLAELQRIEAVKVGRGEIVIKSRKALADLAGRG